MSNMLAHVYVFCNEIKNIHATYFLLHTVTLELKKKNFATRQFEQRKVGYFSFRELLNLNNAISLVNTSKGKGKDLFFLCFFFFLINHTTIETCGSNIYM